MWMSSPGWNSGRKNPSPCRWSRCRCVSRMCSSVGAVVVASRRRAAACRCRRRARARARSSRRTSTHDVLPPYRTVSAPGAASDPRHPQTRARISRRRRRASSLPEHRDHAVHLAGRAEQRVGRRLVRCGARRRSRWRSATLVRRPALEERDPGGRVAPAQRRAVGRRELERRAELARGISPSSANGLPISSSAASL